MWWKRDKRPIVVEPTKTELLAEIENLKQIARLQRKDAHRMRDERDEALNVIARIQAILPGSHDPY